ncbi:fructose-bisphosphate aldolase, class II [Paenibacillus sp. UNCCL117]|uniref:class II fructose-bisphosphate aldolase n=1 Tax=unclassified Paenibacillus TaxID=185978 RepID=UPI00087E2766|nr:MULTISPECIES: class II fructose-bisphosphate aldolase [unclassified Paenibacillus]SDC94445.1 fructose-bisphosphate aldolase, class II [Paenibacillus sp. cl123]SFW29813.1 fructose-bisphosphate aldolase, class II [Paenibacillus sp. UNCCL117]
MLISMRQMLDRAKAEKYAVAAPNTFNVETVEAAFQAASELRAPIIIDCAGVHGIELIAELTRFYDRRYPEVPVALNLDHGSTYEEAILAIKAGFTSVMADRSTLPYEENVAQVKEIVQAAHAVGVSVEAELGHVGMGFEYNKTRDGGLTDPDEAVHFVRETNIDCLAVAVGTSHGSYQGEPRIEFDRLAVMRRRIDIPLVLHGGSGTGDENLRRAVETGIQKVNLFTDLSSKGIGFLRAYLGGERPEMDKTLTEDDGPAGEFDGDNRTINLCDAFAAGAKGYKEALKHYMVLFGSANKA